MSQNMIIYDAAADKSDAEWALKPRTVRAGPSVIVVGPDGVGKTTIVKLLSERLGIPSFKCPSEKLIFSYGGARSLEFDHTLTHFLKQTGYRFISDRGYPCEWVYSQVFGRPTDAVMLDAIDFAHASLGTKILYMYSSIQPAQDDDIVPPEKYFDVKQGYDRFMSWTDCDVFAIDTAEMLADYANGGDSSEVFATRIIDGMGIR